MYDLSRMLKPKSIAVIGGGAWGCSVVEQAIKMGFDGPILPVHPHKKEICGIPATSSVEALSEIPDAVFIGVNRNATIDVVRSLAAINAGGAICFASGFSEAQAELEDGVTLQQALLDAAQDMPVIGPNCYGYINYLDRALLWPDQHGGQPVENGVAVITQSSNIAINLTMQRRGLPLAYILTAGNQAQIGWADLGCAVLEDNRVTALGLHIEGISDIRAFERLAEIARQKRKRIVALKSGRSEQARAATISHTASLAGSDAGAQALLDRLGVARVQTLPELLESLKLLHFTGGLKSNRILSLSCSGGEASLMADTAQGRKIALPPLSAKQETALRDALGPMVALSNPLDYHTFIWNDEAAMAQTFAAMMSGDADLACLIADFPRSDHCDPSAWECIFSSGAAARAQSAMPLSIVATLPDAFPEELAHKAIGSGLIPLMGLSEALTAIEVASSPKRPVEYPTVLLPGSDRTAHMIPEGKAKQLLQQHGLPCPYSVTVATQNDLPTALKNFSFPVALKTQGLAHKSDQGGVVLNIETPEQAIKTAQTMPSEQGFLIEEMITDTLTELLIGVVRDPAHGFVLTLGAGGILTEILQDSTSLLLPVGSEHIQQALQKLRIAPLLTGYRGKPGANLDAISQAVLAVQDFVITHADKVEEVEINPLICTSKCAIAADALIRMEE